MIAILRSANGVDFAIGRDDLFGSSGAGLQGADYGREPAAAPR